MAALEVLSAETNRVTLRVDLQGREGMRIYRARHPDGPYEDVGVAFEEVFEDSKDLEPGKAYFYHPVPWSSPYIFPEARSLKADSPVSATVPRAPKEKRVVLSQGRETFTVTLGGFLDESSSVTKGPEVYCPGPNSSMPPYEQVFEPNLYVAMENAGQTDVLNPWLVAEGRRDWWSVEGMVQEIEGGRGLTDTEKAMAIWQFVVDEVYDSRAGMSWYDDMADPVKLVNVYGFEGCIANAVVSRRLAEAMGLEAREVWLGGTLDGYGRGRSCGHDIFEVFTEGGWHFLDTDLMVFFLKRDNRTVAGSEDLSRDIDLLRRSHRNLGLCGKDLPGKDFYFTQFREGRFVFPPNKGGVWADNAGNITHAAGEFPPLHTMAFRLRPGEKLVRYWGNVGKNVIRARRLHPEVRFSNGKLIYRPDLRRSLVLKGTQTLTNVAQETSGRKPALHPERCGEISDVVWKVESPYAIAGGCVGIAYRRETQEDGIEVLLSRDGKNWRSVWVGLGHRADACVDLDWFLNPALYDWREERDLAWRAGPCYAYYIKVAMWAGSKPENVGIDAIRFNTDLQCATRSLPSLFCGGNRISYRDDSEGDRKVRVTYGWQEEYSLHPPEAPVLVFPEDDADVQALDFEFRWRKPLGGSARVDDYHVQVSRYPDFRWCVCPTFDRYVGRTAYAGKTRWQPEFPNLLNPDETYYWRVRARNAKGVWGQWSEVRAFTPHGPRFPVDLKIECRGRVLRWSPNPAGNQPASYRVYGAMEPGGFSISEENLLGTVGEPCWPLGGSSKKGMFYRVVAVDSRGVPSTPSKHIVF